MKKVFIIVLSVCLFSCASFRFATPSADSSVYFEYSLDDVLSVNIAGENAFKGDSLSKYFHIISDVYLRYDKNQHIILLDNEGNSKSISNSRDFYREYVINKNGDYDPSKIYRVKYTLYWNGSSYSSELLSIEIDSIEGLLTYAEYSEKEREREQMARIVQEKEYELRVKADFETAYQQALSQNGVSGLAAFILGGRKSGIDWYEYEWDNNVIEECRKEIARRLTNNQNITFIKISEIGNPYAFDKNAIYFCWDRIKVNQWRTDGSLLCLLGGDVLIIDKVPDITKIGNFIGNAYLQYKGASEVRFVDGRNEMIAVFDLLFHF